MKFIELANKLDAIGVEEPKNEAYLILEYLFGARKQDVILDREKEYDDKAIETILREREKHTPIQYIFHKWSFMGEDFYVDENCLIPRPDTEILVYEAEKRIGKDIQLLDACTGSGCVGLSLLKRNKDIKSATLLDISDKALSIAEKNAENLGVTNRAKFVLCDITKDFPSEQYDMILSNPPYIPTEDIDALSEEVKKEPLISLDGGIDGMAIIKCILNCSSAHLKSHGFLIMEFGYDQKEKITDLIEKHISEGKYSKYSIVYDYSKNSRVAVIEK